MMNPKNIVRLLQEQFARDPLYDFDSIVTSEEKDFVEHLSNLIKDAAGAQIFFETSSTLCFEEESVIPETCTVYEDFEFESEVVINDNNKKYKGTIDFEYKKRAVSYWKSGKNGNLKISTVQNQFKHVKDAKMLYRWESQIKEAGGRLEKLAEICKNVMNEFQNAHDKSLPIHDMDIRRWALKARSAVNLSSKLFTASAKWVHNFKQRHNIVSRKINKFVTQAQMSNKNDKELEADKFVSKIREKISLIGPDNVHNSDQSGFNLELHAGRTLSFKGDTKVERKAQSLNSLTHSYTIQPIISASGLLKSPLLIVLQEKGGKFGPTVEKNLYSAENIVVLCSRSGKLSSALAALWYKDIYLPVVDEQSILCLDSWTGQTKQNFENVDTNGKDVNIFTIPAGTTGMIQPLDVYGFRPWKNFVKHFSDSVILYNYNVNLRLRNNILKIQSLTHNQLSAPRFINVFKYSWFKSGYISERPPKCETPVNYCFLNCDGNCEYCDDIAFFKCAWCKKFMCFTHFFDPDYDSSPHYCTNHQL